MTYPGARFNMSRNHVSYQRLVIFLAGILVVTLSGCDSSLPVGLDGSQPMQARRVVITRPAPGLTIADASLTISSLDFTTTISHLASDPFTFLFLWVKDTGLFLVSLDRLPFAEEAGQFSNKVLKISCAGIEVVFENSIQPLLSDDVERPVFVAFFSYYYLFEPDVREPDLILGLADEFAQIPGFEHRNLPPESCFSSG